MLSASAYLDADEQVVQLVVSDTPTHDSSNATLSFELQRSEGLPLHRSPWNIKLTKLTRAVQSCQFNFEFLIRQDINFFPYFI